MARNYEAYPGGGEYGEKVDARMELPYADADLKQAVVDPEASPILYEISPRLWVRSAIAVGSGRKPSEVNDFELVDRLQNGGFLEWDPSLTKALTSELQEEGYFVFNLAA